MLIEIKLTRSAQATDVTESPLLLKSHNLVTYNKHRKLTNNDNVRQIE